MIEVKHTNKKGIDNIEFKCPRCGEFLAFSEEAFNLLLGKACPKHEDNRKRFDKLNPNWKR